MPNLPLEVTPLDVKRRLDAGERLALVDVREPEEHRAAHIEGAQLIPMRTIPANLQSIEGLSDDADVIVFCHHGVRSLQVVNWLREQGVANTASMAGGIDRWSAEIDPAVPRYY
jgi:rhodanese-related sulfurtransferase